MEEPETALPADFLGDFLAGFPAEPFLLALAGFPALAETFLTDFAAFLEAAPAAFQQALNDAVTAFIVDKNVDNFANSLVQAAKESESNK